MAWTAEKPLVAGKYWYDPNGHHQSGRNRYELRIVAIRSDDNGNLVPRIFDINSINDPDEMKVELQILAIERNDGK